jgi:hypothetical protein
MRKSAILIVLALLAALAIPAVAQDRTLTLATTTAKPTADGVVAKNEYPATLTVGTSTVSMARSADALSIAISAQTQGWVAIGLGSSRMNGATIFIGYVANGKLELKVQQGSGHSHADLASDALIASAGKEENGVTTIELTLKPGAFIAKGQTELPFIMAWGNADSFFAIHAGRFGGTVKLAD